METVSSSIQLPLGAKQGTVMDQGSSRLGNNQFTQAYLGLTGIHQDVLEMY